MDPTTPASESETSIGEFRILEEIGRGGMGIVYRAEQASLAREVALKVVSRTTLGPEQIERFEREARTAARLHHTNIVPVFQVGQVDDVSFYAMQLIHGESLDEVLGALNTANPQRRDWQARFPEGLSLDAMRSHRGTRTAWEAATRLILQVADALAHAHAQGVLHRDVKPGNLLLDDRSTLWLSDFGLARRELDPQLTRSGEVVGTLKYLAPEALRGRYDERSDLYALGMTFYELLTWHPPFEEKTPAELLVDISQNRPRSPRSHVPDLPRDLETIVHTAIDPQREHRYENVQAFRDDLLAFLEGRPIRARRIHALERFARWSRRNPVLSALTGTIAFLLLLVAAVAIFGYVRTDRERAKAEANLRLALEAFEEVFSQVGPGGLLVAKTGFTPAEGEEEIALPPIVSPEYVHVLEKLLGFYERFAEANADDPELRLDMARAHQRVGDIHLRFGDHEASRKSFHRALDIYGEMASGSLAHWSERVEILDHLSWLHRVDGDRDAALDHLARALDLLDTLSGEETHARSYRLAQVRLATASLGLLPLQAATRQERYREFLERREAAVQLARSLVEEDPADPEGVLCLARLLRQARVRSTSSDSEDREDSRVEAIALLEGLVQRHPLEPEYLHELAATLGGIRYGRRGARGIDREELERAIAIDEKLVASYPTVPRYAVTLAQHRLMLGDHLASTGNREEGEDVLARGLEVVLPLAERYPEIFAYDLIRIELGTRQAHLALSREEEDPERTRVAIEALEGVRLLTEELANREGAMARRAVRLLIQQNADLEQAHGALGQEQEREKALRARIHWESQARSRRPEASRPMDEGLEPRPQR